MLSIARKCCGTGIFAMCEEAGVIASLPQASPVREMALKRPKEVTDLANGLEELLRKMSSEQLQQVLELPLEAEPDVVARQLVERELARRQVH
jgi:hypothetical protein